MSKYLQLALISAISVAAVSPVFASHSEEDLDTQFELAMQQKQQRHVDLKRARALFNEKADLLQVRTQGERFLCPTDEDSVEELININAGVEQLDVKLKEAEEQARQVRREEIAKQKDIFNKRRGQLQALTQEKEQTYPEFDNSEEELRQIIPINAQMGAKLKGLLVEAEQKSKRVKQPQAKDEGTSEEGISPVDMYRIALASAPIVPAVDKKQEEESVMVKSTPTPTVSPIPPYREERHPGGRLIKFYNSEEGRTFQHPKKKKERITIGQAKWNGWLLGEVDYSNWSETDLRHACENGGHAPSHKILGKQVGKLF